MPGITAIAATGHSPGHYVDAIQSLGRTLINIGDLSHHHILLLKDLGGYTWVATPIDLGTKTQPSVPTCRVSG